MAAKQKFINHSPDHLGEDAGTLFFKNAWMKDGKQVIKWEEADPSKHSTDNVYVRHYRPDGDIGHYVLLETQLDIIEYRNFCKSNRIQHTEIKNLAYITRAITDYQRKMLDIKKEKKRDMSHG